MDKEGKIWFVILSIIMLGFGIYNIVPGARDNINIRNKLSENVYFENCKINITSPNGYSNEAEPMDCYMDLASVIHIGDKPTLENSRGAISIGVILCTISIVILITLIFMF